MKNLAFDVQSFLYPVDLQKKNITPPRRVRGEIHKKKLQSSHNFRSKDIYLKIHKIASGPFGSASLHTPPIQLVAELSADRLQVHKVTETRP